MKVSQGVQVADVVSQGGEVEEEVSEGEDSNLADFKEFDLEEVERDIRQKSR